MICGWVPGLWGVDGIRDTHAIMSSVMRCELSIRPRSASNESAAEDLYALHAGSKQQVTSLQKCLDALYVVANAAEQVGLIHGRLDISL